MTEVRAHVCVCASGRIKRWPPLMPDKERNYEERSHARRDATFSGISAFPRDDNIPFPPSP